jgi:hypothetical protein
MGRRVRAGAALGLAVLALTGCSVRDAGQAAVSDEFTISQAMVDSEVRAVLAQVDSPTGQPPAGLALATTQRLVQDALFAAKAADLGLTVTATEVEQGRAEFAAQYGGDQGLVDAAAQSGIPAGSLDTFVRSNLLFTKISEAVDPGGAAAAAQQAAREEMGRFSEEIDVRVAPRYGTWSPVALEIVPGSDVVTPAEPTS